MGDDALITRSNGQVIDADHINLLNRVLKEDFVGRDAAGAATSGQSLGTAVIPWGSIYGTNLILNGQSIDPSDLTATPNRVLSGQVRLTSDFPDYIRAAGGAASFTLLATATNLQIDVNGALYEYTSDIVKGSLTVAPSTNNTCQINNTILAGQEWTKNLGEDGTVIEVDNMQTELSSRVGEYVALLNQTTNEIIYCKINSTTELCDCRRGFFIDSAASPINRAVLNNNDILQILSLGFVFLSSDLVTIDVSYRVPTVGGNPPTTPQTGDYWLDTSVSVWKRYSGSSFDQINRTFVGYIALDTTNCIGSRSEYFSKTYKDNNTLVIDLETTDIIKATMPFIFSVDARDDHFRFAVFKWNAAANMEPSVVRTAGTDYYIYITEDGRPIISDKKPYVAPFLHGLYHPFESWRCAGKVYNNASNEFEIVAEKEREFKLQAPDIDVFERLTLSNNAVTPATNIDVSGGSYSKKLNIRAIALEKDLSTTWAFGDGVGGLDPGSSPTPNGWYYAYAIYNPAWSTDGSPVDYVFTTTFDSVTVPGIVEKKYLGAIKDSGVALALFEQRGRKFIYKEPRQTFVGSVTSTTQTLPLAGIPDLPNQIQTIARATMLAEIVATVVTLKFFRLFSSAYTDVAITKANADIIAGRQNNIFIYSSGSQLDVLTDNSGQLQIRASTAVADDDTTVNILGWEDINLEEG